MRLIRGPRAQPMAWSNPATWGGSVPTTNDAVNIPAGTTVILDTGTANLASLEIDGTLKTSGNGNVSITSGYVLVGATGILEIGTVSSPYLGTATIEVNGAEASRATRFVADNFNSTGTGNGTLTRLAASTGAVQEQITATWSSATDFTVSGTVSGALGSGTVGTLFNNKIRFIAVAGGTPWAAGATRVVVVESRGFTNSGLPRSIQVEDGGTIRLIGNPPSVVRTRLNADLAITATSMTLADSVSWASGDTIVVGPTDFTDTTSGVAEVFTLNGAVSGTAANVNVAATRYKWGKMQYVTDAGMSLTADTLTKPADFTQGNWDLIPKTLDERAAVINLTRNIVIQAPNDSAWTTSKFGVHCMFMGLNSRVQLLGVEVKRGGQAGAIGRYPLHFHMLSYNMQDGMTLPSDGTFLGATNNANHYVKKCSINVSSQRAMVIHGTHGALLQDNVAYDITGHAVFLENGAEEQNTIERNVVMQMTVPTSGNKLIDSDTSNAFGGTFGTSCYWLTNPYNTVKDNWGFGGVVGCWNVFAGSQCFDLSQQVAIVPRTRPVLEHSGNVMGCNVRRGFGTEAPPTNNRGATESAVFFAGSLVNGSRFNFTSNTHWKNKDAGYRNRVNAPGFYTSWTSADNGMIDYAGQADQSVFLDNALLVGVSLNNGNSAETRATDNRRAGFTSYDEGFVPRNIIAVNFPVRNPPAHSRNSFDGQAVCLQGGGLVRMGEYIFPIWTFTIYGPWYLIGSTPGYMCSPPHFDGQPVTAGNEKFTLGICRDVSGEFTGTPNRHVVWNSTFYTTDAADLQAWSHAEAKHTSSTYIAIQSSGSVSGIEENFYTPNQPFYVDRLSASDLSTVVGSWNIPDSRTVGGGVSHFKHFGAMRGGVYRIGWNGELPSGDAVANFSVSFMHAAADEITLAVAWNHLITIGTVYLRWDPDGIASALSQFELDNNWGTSGKRYAVKFTNSGMTSAADVHAATTLKYWQDPTNDWVWLKLKGDIVADVLEYRLDGNLNPNRSMGISIREAVVP